ncbi:MAG: peptide deformylase [Alphaproteobacteria bacterium]|nr:peptide deformylase [Alphaproteobacteria bacterium]MBV8547977.1 peptide deformylase [Alphaproteobacteria bacterium]
MALLNVRTIPDPVLRQVAKPVANVDARVRKLMDDMVETMYAEHGIGLAATQVGILERIIVVDLTDERDGSEAIRMVNPEIIWTDTAETYKFNEGCFSVAADVSDRSSRFFAIVERPKRVKVRYLDHNGKQQEIEAEDLYSSALQHEIDHLNGILFIDHLSKLKRDMILKKLDKARREQSGRVL